MSNKDKAAMPLMADEFADLLWGEKSTQLDELPQEAEPAKDTKIEKEDQTILPIPVKDSFGKTIGYNLRDISKCTSQEFITWCRDVIPIPGYPGIELSFFDNQSQRNKAFQSIVEICARKLLGDKVSKERFIN